MLKLGDNKELENFSRLLYWVSLFFSQVVYSLFSAIETAIVAPVTEASRITNLILKEAYELDSETYFTNALVCISSGVFLFGILSIIFIRFTGLFRKIPCTFYYGVFLWLGFLQFQAAKALLPNNFHFLIIFFVSTILYYLQYRYKTQSFSFIFALFCCLSLNSMRFIYQIPKNTFIEKGVFISEIKIFDGFTFFEENFSFKKIDYKIIWKLKYKIVLLALFCIFNILLNLFTFENYSKTQFSLKKEFIAHSFTNMICSFGVFPSCFVCSYSTILFENSIDTQRDKFILIILYFCLVFVVNKFFQFIPLHIQALFPIIVGWNILHEAYNDIKKTGLMVKLFCLVIASVLFFLTY